MLKKITKVGMGIILFATVLCFAACGIRKNVENESNNSEKQENNLKFKYKELSNVSSLAMNNTTEYTSEYTDVPLYEWCEGVVLPVPKLEEAKFEGAMSNMLAFSNVTEEVFDKYVELLKEEHGTEIKEKVTGDVKSISIRSMAGNYEVVLSWEKKSVNYETGEVFENYLVMDTLFFYQEDSRYTNEEILQKAVKQLNIDESRIKDLWVYNVTSASNRKDGFEVYFIGMPTDLGLKCNVFGYEEDVFMYLCVMQGDEMVFFEPNMVMYGNSNNQIEFLRDSDGWKMYVLAHTGNKSLNSSNTGKEIIDEYVMHDNKFTYVNTDYLEEIMVDGKVNIIMKKVNGHIELYYLVKDKDPEVLYQNMWSVGEKIGVYR